MPVTPLVDVREVLVGRPVPAPEVVEGPSVGPHQALVVPVPVSVSEGPKAGVVTPSGRRVEPRVEREPGVGPPFAVEPEEETRPQSLVESGRVVVGTRPLSPRLLAPPVGESVRDGLVGGVGCGPGPTGVDTNLGTCPWGLPDQVTGGL